MRKIQLHLTSSFKVIGTVWGSPASESISRMALSGLKASPVHSGQLSHEQRLFSLFPRAESYYSGHFSFWWLSEA